ncbi:MAG: hypothetical protein EKK47_02490 [Burkholderiales bacterium]|nr:MAG: hypothetical protein EKK47_02490 [Burkholderiales bacterium]
MHPPDAIEKLDKLGIAWFCDRIIGGASITALAKAAGVSRGSLINWLAADPERQRLAHDARRLSASAFDDKAETVLLEANDKFELAKAKELAHHYRWRASKISPEYGDRQELVGAGGAALIPDPYEGLSDRDRHLEAARRVMFVLARGAAAAESQASTSANFAST